MHNIIDQGNKSKADIYLGNLDQARSNSQWAGVDEIVRKVLKHATQERGS